jgi:hypothetical protein
MSETRKIQRERRTIFSFPGVTFHHLIACFEAGKCHIGNRVLFMVSFFGRDDRGEGGQREMNAREAVRR